MLLHTDQTCEFGEADNNLFRRKGGLFKGFIDAIFKIRSRNLLEVSFTRELLSQDNKSSIKTTRSMSLGKLILLSNWIIKLKKKIVFENFTH